MVVVGAGILGLMTAINLVERGLSVVVVEKGDIAGEQSCRFYGQVMTYKMPDATFQLHHLAKQRWREMNAKVGADTSYRTQGRSKFLSMKKTWKASESGLMSKAGK